MLLGIAAFISLALVPASITTSAGNSNEYKTLSIESERLIRLLGSDFYNNVDEAAWLYNVQDCQLVAKGLTCQVDFEEQRRGQLRVCRN